MKNIITKKGNFSLKYILDKTRSKIGRVNLKDHTKLKKLANEPRNKGIQTIITATSATVFLTIAVVSFFINPSNGFTIIEQLINNEE